MNMTLADLVLQPAQLAEVRRCLLDGRALLLAHAQDPASLMESVVFAAQGLARAASAIDSFLGPKPDPQLDPTTIALLASHALTMAVLTLPLGSAKAAADLVRRLRSFQNLNV
jgi:hypothetical protein